MDVFQAIFFLIFVCYARAVWSRIPFASVNLLTACTAIRKNGGVVIVAYFYLALAFGWTLLWSISVMGVWEAVVQSETQEVGGNVTYTSNSVNWGYLFLLFLSYFFTHQVIQNTTHVTVAGTVGSWCEYISNETTLWIRLELCMTDSISTLLWSTLRVCTRGYLVVLLLWYDWKYDPCINNILWVHLLWEFIGGYRSGHQSVGTSCQE